MCGIGAIIALPGSEVPVTSIHAMMEVLKHRGPDDEGYLGHSRGSNVTILGGADSPGDIFGKELPAVPTDNILDCNDSFQVLLGHRRLSIVDLSVAGHQPFCTEDRRFWIVYNGEIYNYRELRDDLVAIGFSFISESDTEVILKAWMAWGKECLSRFNGMWGFVIYDSETQNFFAARDRFGVKPLYYWYSPEGFLAFSSEIKGFTVLPGWNPLVNPGRAYDFLVNGLMDHTRETLFADVFQVRGGECLSFTPQSIRTVVTECWYSPPLKPEDTIEGFSIEGFRSILRDAVSLRVRADVPVGSCLSGGLDSSSIVCLVSELIRSSGEATLQKTFSATSTDPRWSEKQYSDMVIQHFPIEAHYVYPDCIALLSSLDQLIWHQDEPCGSSSIFAQWSVFQAAAREGMKVMLDGQGADEVLFGYADFVYPVCCELLRNLHFIRLYHEIRCVSAKTNTPVTRILGKVLFYSLPRSIRHFLNNSVFASKYAPVWLDPDLVAGIYRSESMDFIPVESDPAALSEKTLLNTSLPMLLHWEDRNSMAHSIESRVPFTDFRVVELSLTLPSLWKWRDCISKWVLRESMRGILPEAIRTRQDKMGFVTPEEHWMNTADPDAFKALLESASSDSDGLILDSIIHDFDRFLEKKREFSHDFWRIIVFCRWMKVFHVESDLKSGLRS